MSGTEERPGDASSGGGDDGVVARGRPPTLIILPARMGNQKWLTARMQTMLGGFASLYPLYRPALGVSEGEHAVRPYTLVSPFGACRGAQPQIMKDEV